MDDAIAAVRVALHEVTELVEKARFAVGGERHHFVLVGRVEEAEMPGDVLVEHPERMRHRDLLEPPVGTAAEHAEARGRALALAIDGEHRAVFERRREKGARLVREMVFDVMPGERPIVLHAAKTCGQVVRRAARQLPGRIDHVGEEQRQPWVVRAVCGRRERQANVAVRRNLLQQHGRIVGISHVIDLRELDTGLGQAEVDCIERQLPGREWHRSLAVLHFGETFLFRRREHFTVGDQAGRTVVKCRIDAEGVHRSGRQLERGRGRPRKRLAARSAQQFEGGAGHRRRRHLTQAIVMTFRAYAAIAIATRHGRTPCRAVHRTRCRRSAAGRSRGAGRPAIRAALPRHSAYRRSASARVVRRRPRTSRRSAARGRRRRGRATRARAPRSARRCGPRSDRGPHHPAWRPNARRMRAWRLQ